jgi:hypothetical protein
MDFRLYCIQPMTPGTYVAQKSKLSKPEFVLVGMSYNPNDVLGQTERLQVMRPNGACGYPMTG